MLSSISSFCFKSNENPNSVNKEKYEFKNKKGSGYMKQVCETIQNDKDFHMLSGIELKLTQISNIKYEYNVQKLSYNLEKIFKAENELLKLFTNQDDFHEFLLKLFDLLILTYDKYSFSYGIRCDNIAFNLKPLEILFIEYYMKCLFDSCENNNNPNLWKTPFENLQNYIIEFFSELNDMLKNHNQFLAKLHLSDRIFLKIIEKEAKLKEIKDLKKLRKIYFDIIDHEYQTMIIKNYNLSDLIKKTYNIEINELMNNEVKLVNANIRMKEIKVRFDELEELMQLLMKSNEFINYFVYFSEEDVQIKIFMMNFFSDCDLFRENVTVNIRICIVLGYSLLLLYFWYIEFPKINTKSLKYQLGYILCDEISNHQNPDALLLNELKFLSDKIKYYCDIYTTNLQDALNDYPLIREFLEKIPKLNSDDAESQLNNIIPTIDTELQRILKLLDNSVLSNYLISKKTNNNITNPEKSEFKTKPKRLKILDERYNFEDWIIEYSGVSLSKIFRSTSTSISIEEFVKLIQKNYPEYKVKLNESGLEKHFYYGTPAFHKITKQEGENHFSIIEHTKDYIYERLQFSEGKKDIEGKIYYNNLTTYKGQLKEYKRHGRGVLYGYDDSIKLKGQWEDDIFSIKENRKPKIICSNNNNNGSKDNQENFVVNDHQEIDKMNERSKDTEDIWNKEFEEEKEMQSKDESELINRKILEKSNIHGFSEQKDSIINTNMLNKDQDNTLFSVSTPQNMENRIEPEKHKLRILEVYENDHRLEGYAPWIPDEEIKILKDYKWLNSKNIAFYMNYLKTKHENEYWAMINEAKVKIRPSKANFMNDDSTDYISLSTGIFMKMLKFKRIFYYPVDAMTILTLKNLIDSESTWNYEIVKYITKQYFKTNFLIFDFYDCLLFVIDHLNAHWSLAEINCESLDKFKFILYDSQASTYRNYWIKEQPKENNILRVLAKYCKDEINDKCCKTNLNNPHNCPYKKRLENAEYIIYDTHRQQNSYDGGVYVCGYMREITEQKEKIEFDQSDADKLRKTMVNLIIEESEKKK